MARESTLTTVAALLLGAAAGFVAGVLLAPAPGAATRETLRQRASESLARAGSTIADSSQGLTSAAGHWVERAQGGLGSAWESARNRLGLAREPGAEEAGGSELPGAPDPDPEAGGSY
ncbi:MAG: YtxH domain-containing protein [Clostridia bacterium]|nr:YtxH domain-containing protein [Clostridia bacterium]